MMAKYLVVMALSLNGAAYGESKVDQRGSCKVVIESWLKEGVGGTPLDVGQIKGTKITVITHQDANHNTRALFLNEEKGLIDMFNKTKNQFDQAEYGTCIAPNGKEHEFISFKIKPILAQQNISDSIKSHKG